MNQKIVLSIQTLSLFDYFIIGAFLLFGFLIF
jgi:hypothetical protein